MPGATMPALLVLNIYKEYLMVYMYIEKSKSVQQPCRSQKNNSHGSSVTILGKRVHPKIRTLVVVVC